MGSKGESNNDPRRDDKARMSFKHVVSRNRGLDKAKSWKVESFWLHPTSLPFKDRKDVRGLGEAKETFRKVKGRLTALGGGQGRGSWSQARREVCGACGLRCAQSKGNQLSWRFGW